MLPQVWFALSSVLLVLSLKTGWDNDSQKVELHLFGPCYLTNNENIEIFSNVQYFIRESNDFFSFCFFIIINFFFQLGVFISVSCVVISVYLLVQKLPKEGVKLDLLTSRAQEARSAMVRLRASERASEERERAIERRERLWESLGWSLSDEEVPEKYERRHKFMFRLYLRP